MGVWSDIFESIARGIAKGPSKTGAKQAGEEAVEGAGRHTDAPGSRVSGYGEDEEPTGHNRICKSYTDCPHGGSGSGSGPGEDDMLFNVCFFLLVGLGIFYFCAYRPWRRRKARAAQAAAAADGDVDGSAPDESGPPEADPDLERPAASPSGWQNLPKLPVVQVRAGRSRALEPQELPPPPAVGETAAADDAPERRRREELVRAAIALQVQQGCFSGAEKVHREVGADHWGITWESFEDFMQTVRDRIASGDLENTQPPPPRPAYAEEKFWSPAMGPNMYQVNDQVIVPVTKADPNLPGASWAFRGGRAGAKVTLFVTHAWQEGAFEFEAQLRRAWPTSDGAREGAAYICFLSNPQNLTGGLLREMLQTIATSPFKVALDRMPSPGFVIMASTANAAIHERMWCVFEAYVAMEKELPIIVAGSGVDLATNRATVLGDAADLEAHRRNVATCDGNTAKNAKGILLNVFDPVGLLWHVGRTAVNAARSAKARFRSDGLVGAGHLVDVRRAECTSEDDKRAIKRAIRGKEGEINRLVAECILLAANHERRGLHAEAPCP